jgi:gamma-glutamyl:cysteine ligase YbdK (ATP-grasp superfamily)
MKWIESTRRDLHTAMSDYQIRQMLGERISSRFQRALMEDTVEELMGVCQMVKETVEEFGENED